MFYHVKKLTKNLEVDPKDYGPALNDTIKRKLTNEVDNTCSERYGFIIKVFNIDIERLEGKINPTGMNPGGTAIFKVPYDAIVFKPFRGEVLNGIVKTSAQQGLFVQCGPLQVFIAKTNLSSEDNQIVWNPEHSPPCWMSEDGKVVIQDGSHMRLRLIGVRMSNDITNANAVGTILDDYLGPLES
uniref:DNA-directed RNA polymerase II subunit RPB7 n=1 Tax=Hemiselmis tepida TaxID=464990 RepID=A0A7S0VYG7_9CRYP|mmetsp:Transcript_6245/g.15040  ORF Transcript_6245/g.15040 Transcript_6245/m.15040 type:complete len:185 (+) Transcript_6245:89-643(+)|eukprot:CAMPEP_0173440846 /NCGR_PEP_ID=MMETSP1357-20121228/23641_1 /TAXON_ID=77926 /ORGANISM="Hemiselmis rufescens, Strain PCC563" /LENGTH=184 /DNA_ID=CAMNT_0014406383 /DNA_START=57 /DNA_END=611 /DNA_ORIENTATION=-